MVESLRILILEDNPADAELIQFELQEAEIVFTSKVVMTEEDFVYELQEFSPDLILSDYDLPKYNGALALAAAKRRCPDTPFILVTGAVTEDRAIDILTQGAKDYVLKNRLEQRLVPAVRRSLAEAEDHKARKIAETALKNSERQAREQLSEIQTIYDSVPIGLCFLDRDLRYVRVNQRLAEMNSRPVAEHIGRTVDEVIPDMASLVHRMAESIFQTGEPVLNYEITNTDDFTPSIQGSWLSNWMPLKDSDGGIIGINFAVEEITELKTAEKHLQAAHGEMELKVRERTAALETEIEERRQIEEKLLESEAKYRVVADNTYDFEFWMNPADHFIYASPSSKRITGYCPQDYIDDPLLHRRIIHPDDLDIFNWHVEKDTNKHRRNGECDYRIIHADGSIRWISHVCQPVFSDQGEYQGQRGSNRDITERKRMEEEAKLHAAIVETVAEGIVLVGLDDNIIKWTNHKFERLFGYDPGELVGMHIDSVNAPTERTPTETRISIVDELRQAGEWHGEIKNIRKNGTHFWCHIHVSLFNHPAFGPVMVSAHTDITEQKNIEEKLRKGEADARQSLPKIEEIYRNSPLGLCLLDRELRWVRINDKLARMNGFTASEHIGKTVRELLPSTAEAVEASMREILKTGVPKLNIEINDTDFSGRKRTWLANWLPVMNSSGEVIGINVIAEDITRGKLAGESLKQNTG